jgi:hypothetical protein
MSNTAIDTATNTSAENSDKEFKLMKRKGLLKSAFHMASAVASGAAMAYALKACTVAALCTAGAPLTLATTVAIASTGFLMGTYRAYRAYKQDVATDASTRFLSRKTFKAVALSTGLSVLGGAVALYYGDAIMEAATKLYDSTLETLGLLTYEPPQPMMTQIDAMPSAPAIDVNTMPEIVTPANDVPVNLASMNVAPSLPDMSALSDITMPEIDTAPPAAPAPMIVAEMPVMLAPVDIAESDMESFSAFTATPANDFGDAALNPTSLTAPTLQAPEMVASPLVTDIAPQIEVEFAPQAEIEVTPLTEIEIAPQVAPEEPILDPIATNDVIVGTDITGEDIVVENMGGEETNADHEAMLDEDVNSDAPLSEEPQSSSSAVTIAHDILTQSMGPIEGIYDDISEIPPSHDFVFEDLVFEEPVVEDMAIEDVGALENQAFSFDDMSATDFSAGQTSLSFGIEAQTDTNTLDPFAAIPFEVVEIHTVSRGENLWNIVKDHYGLTSNQEIRQYVDAVAQANEMTSTMANNVDIGNEVLLPAASTLGHNTELALDWRAMDAETAARLQETFQTNASFSPRGAIGGTIDCQPQITSNGLTFSCQASGNAGGFSVGDQVVITHLLPRV